MYVMLKIVYGAQKARQDIFLGYIFEKL